MNSNSPAHLFSPEASPNYAGFVRHERCERYSGIFEELQHFRDHPIGRPVDVARETEDGFVPECERIDTQYVPVHGRVISLGPSPGRTY